jgi:hypothetical protein
VIYADILFSSLLAAVLKIYSQHFYTSSSFNATRSSLKKREARSLANFVHSPSCEILRYLEHLLAIGNVIANGAEKLVLVTKALKDSAQPRTFVGHWECNCQWRREVVACHKGAKRFHATSYICWQLET